MHISKAGGGAVRTVFEALKIRFLQTHEAERKKHLAGKRNVFLVTIRDPVDMFESAFNFRTLAGYHCNNTRTKTNFSFNNLQFACKHIKINYAKSRYNFNDNDLTEALCNKREREYAKQIGHMKYSLIDFIETLLQERERSSFEFIVKELGYDFLSQILSVIEVVVNMTKHEKRSEISEQMQNYFYRNKPLQVSNDYQHKSTTTEIVTEPISALGAFCIVRYYENDYKLL